MRFALRSRGLLLRGSRRILRLDPSAGKQGHRESNDQNTQEARIPNDHSVGRIPVRNLVACCAFAVLRFTPWGARTIRNATASPGFSVDWILRISSILETCWRLIE